MTDQDEARAVPIVKLAGVFYSLVALAAFGYAALFGALDTLFGESAPSGAGVVAGAATGLGIVVACRVGYDMSEVLRRASEALGAFLGPVTIPQALFLGLISGFAEELLFRGALWPHLGLVGTSILFGLLHWVPVRALRFYPLFAMLAGFLLGWLRLETGSAVPPMLAHVVVNAINLAVLGRIEKQRPGGPSAVEIE